MRIEDVYRPGALTCSVTDSLLETAKAMTTQRVGALALLDGNTIVGIISERDITRAVAEEKPLHETPCVECAAQHVETARPDEETLDVARRMLDAGIRHLPVIHNRFVVGVVSMRDLLAVEAWA